MNPTGKILAGLAGVGSLIGLAGAQTPIPVTSPITPLPTNTLFIQPFNNITSNGFNMTQIIPSVLAPYTWPVMNMITPIVFLALMFTYIAMWMGHGSVRYTTIMGLIFGSMILFGSGGLGISLPPEIPQIAYGIILASFAGLILSIWKTY